ncbi:MAG: cph2 3 [Pseudonocardiales bacterium]|nr:cph2 3 [Pseudonocardiales bacterium]
MIAEGPATGLAAWVPSPAATETLNLLRAGADHPLVASFPAGAMLIFDHDLRYLCAGGLALADVGLSTVMMEGRTIFEVFEPDFIAVIEPQYRLALSGVESVIDLHYQGNVYSQRLAPIRDADGQIVAGMGYTQDVTRARRSESGLRESEEHNRLAFEYAPIGNALVALDGRYERVNQAMCDLTGYSADELRRRTAADITHPDDLAADAAASAGLLRDDIVASTLEKRFRSATGRTVWVTQSASVIRAGDDSPRQFIMQIQDITERKNHEQVLAEERRRLRDAEAIARLGSWELDVATGAVSMSDGLCRLYGVTPGDFGGDLDSVMDCVHPEDRVSVQTAIEQAAENGHPFSIRYRVLRLDDGAMRWFDARGEGLYVDDELLRLGGAVSDVTENVLAAAEVTAAHAMHQAVISTSPDIIFVYDVASRSVVWTNRSIRELLGYGSPEAGALGVDPIEAIIPQSDRESFDAALGAALNADEGQVISLDHRLRHADGSIRWFSRRTTVLDRNDLGAVTRLVGVARDITDAMAIEHRLQHSALHDQLTGLPNRALLTDRLSSAIARCDLTGGELAVLFCDLDGFKRVNDMGGHAVGDLVLKETGRRLLNAVRDSDVVARVGGDEFVIVIDPGTHPQAGAAPPALGDRGLGIELATRICDRIVSALHEPINVKGVEYVVSASIGLSYGRPVQEDQLTMSTPEQLLQDADAAMYKAKSRGKDRFELFQRAMRADVVERGRVEQVLRGALRRALTAADAPDRPRSDANAATLAPAYQPIIDSNSGALVGFEPLARLTDGDGVAIPPDVFIAIAEETGLIRPLGRLMLHQACQQLADWRAAHTGLDEVTIAVNVSGIQAQDGSLRGDVRSVLAETGLAPKDLVLELTETALLQAAPATITGLKVLRDDGVGIAIDDFGTGYASLRYLATLPVSTLKIDKSFTAGLPSDRTSTKIVFAVAGLAADLDLRCIVEGVETETQRAALPAGVHLQGWLFGSPQTAAATDIPVLIASALNHRAAPSRPDPVR